MGTAQVFNQIIKDQLHVNAAWLPITNVFRLGDYGVVSDGIFTSIGNVGRDFSLRPQSAPREADHSELHLERYDHYAGDR